MEKEATVLAKEIGDSEEPKLMKGGEGEDDAPASTDNFGVIASEPLDIFEKRARLADIIGKLEAHFDSQVAQNEVIRARAGMDIVFGE